VNFYTRQTNLFDMPLSSPHLELWQIAALCLLMLPIFFIFNYIVVKYAAKNQKMRQDRHDRVIAASVSRDMNPKTRLKRKPRRKF